MKLLLYCTKSKPYLLDLRNDFQNIKFDTFDTKESLKTGWNVLNGKIVAECDYEVEDIYYSNITEEYSILSLPLISGTEEMYQKMCLDYLELSEYLENEDESADCGYAIHIKNLHIFDKPKELKDYYHNASKLEKAPQNMMMVQEITESDKYQGSYLVKDYVLISIRPEWLCKILNGEKTIEVRKKVLKEML